MMVIDDAGMRRVSRAGGLHLLGRGGEIERLLRLLHPRALAGFEAAGRILPFLADLLVRSLRQLVGGLEQRHVGRRPNRRRRIGPDADAVRRGRRRQLHVVARQ